MRALGIALLLSGCSSILGLEDGTELVADAGVTPPDLFDAPVVVRELHVDPAGGDDANDGSIFNPFKTISHAASVAQAGWIIRLAPATYNEASGEVFPISVVARGVEIVGVEIGGVSIEADGPEPLISLGSGSIRDVNLTNTGGDVLLIDGGARVERVIISDSVEGIVATSLDVIVSRTEVTNSSIGMVIEDSSSGDGVSAIDNNTFRFNDVGLSVSISADEAIGFNNELACNNDADLLVRGGGGLDVPSPVVDHDPPTQGNFGGGIDVTTSDGSSVAIESPVLSENPCP